VKIACITTSRIPSETANSIQVMKACQGLARLEHTLRIYTPDFTPGQARPAQEQLAEQYGLQMPLDIAWLESHPRLKRNDFAWSAVAQARRWGADLLYTWTGQAAVFGLLPGAQKQLRVAFEVHDLPSGRVGPWWYRLFFGLPGRKRLLPITSALHERLAARFTLGHTPVVVVPNGVDLEQYANLPAAPAARRELGLVEAVTVLCAGHLYAGRGVELFTGLAERFPQAQFVWVGGRPQDVAQVRAQAEQRGARNLTFTGFVSNRRLPCYQAAADVLLMPYGRVIAGSSGGNSAEICSPMKMFDYLAAGRAILSSDLPVIHEVLDENTARFAPPDDLPGWAAVLAELLGDAALRQRLGAHARAAAEVYSWKARAERAIAGL
jgi:glycosyltransferase involved in cell wall biosynthesis